MAPDGAGHSLLALAREHAASAQDNLRQRSPRLNVAFAEARHAAELAGKALLVKKTGSYPKIHAVGSHLYRAGLLPRSLDPASTDHALRQATRGEYGVFEPPTPTEVERMLHVASILIEAAAHWPIGDFHEPSP